VCVCVCVCVCVYIYVCVCVCVCVCVSVQSNVTSHRSFSSHAMQFGSRDGELNTTVCNRQSLIFIPYMLFHLSKCSKSVCIYFGFKVSRKKSSRVQRVQETCLAR
jgi:hypothetical protein